MNKVDAIIADDHPLFRIALRQALHDVLEGQLLEADDLRSCLELLGQHPDLELVFLDLNMPGNDGFTGLNRIRNQYPSVQVIMVSAEENPQIIHRAMQFGASGYIPKSADLSTIASAVRVVQEGDTWLPLSMPELSADPNAQAFASKLEQLTPHQFNVLKMVADGLLNKQIAYELQVQETTIKQHVSAVLKKLGVLNRTQAGILFKQHMAFDEQKQP